MKRLLHIVSKISLTIQVLAVTKLWLLYASPEQICPLLREKRPTQPTVRSVRKCS